MQLRSHVAVAVVQAGSCSSDLQTLAWELLYAANAAIKRKRKKKKKEEEAPEGMVYFT